MAQTMAIKEGGASKIEYTVYTYTVTTNTSGHNSNVVTVKATDTIIYNMKSLNLISGGTKIGMSMWVSIQYSDDNSTWTTANTVSNRDGYATGTLTGHKYYRIRTWSNDSGEYQRCYSSIVYPS